MSGRTKTQKRNDKKRAAAKREGAPVPRGHGNAGTLISTGLGNLGITLHNDPLAFILGMLKIYIAWKSGTKAAFKLMSKL